jgi:hypothetical protein
LKDSVLVESFKDSVETTAFHCLVRDIARLSKGQSQ